jgi:hypothetical protein
MYIGIFAFVWAVGCDDPASIVEGQRATIEAKLDGLRRIDSDLGSRAPSTDAALDVPPDADFSRSGNGVIVSPNQLSNPCASPNGRWENMPPTSSDFVPGWNGTADGILRPPACFIRDGRFQVEYDEAFVQRAVDGFGRMKYVLVVRIARAVAPRLQGEEIAAGEIETFQTGAVLGDVLLYDVSSAEFLDGAAFQVTSPDTADVVNEDIGEQLASRLLQRLERTVEALLR